MNKAPFPRLFGFIQTRLVPLTIAVALIQLTVWIVDLIIFADRGKSPIVPLMEAISPWLLLPLLRKLFRGEAIRKVLASPYLAIVGGYILVLSAMLVAYILAFQVLNWIYHAQMHGGIFYYTSLVMVFVWALRPAKNQLAKTEKSAEA